MHNNRPNSGNSADLATLPSPLFIIGAALTGKSELAHSTLSPTIQSAVIGTAPVNEPAFRERLDYLKRLRPNDWQTYESIDSLGSAYKKLSKQYSQILIDSLNQWIGEFIFRNIKSYSVEQIDAMLEADFQDFCKHLVVTESRTCIVSSEVGAGLSPLRPLPRFFRATVSRMNTKIASICRSAILVSAGIPLVLKEPPHLSRERDIS